MDSANSGSLQSSSGGEDEYNSRAADSIFMNTRPPPHAAAFISNPPPPQRLMPPPLFDPLSNYMQFHQNPNSLLLNQNISWPGTTPIRSDPNPSTSHDTINPMLPVPSFQTPLAAAVGEENHRVTVAPAAQNQNQTAARNSRKRSRASRRAPTTVLTTDTTNFRAMVQEFTGIPQPFNNSSFSRSRLDLFGTRATAFDAAQPPPPPYLRRSFAQKVQSPPPFLVSSPRLSSADIDAIAASSNISANLFNVQNPLLSSLLHSNQKYLFSNSSVMASKPSPFVIPLNDMKTSGLDEFGLGDGNHDSAALSGLPNLISPDQITAQTDHNDNTSEKNVVSPDEDDDYEARINGGYSFSRNGKMNNYSASPSSNFDGEKGPENMAATRREGMVESWICSSE